MIYKSHSNLLDNITKNILKNDDKETDEQLALTDGEGEGGEDDGHRIGFEWDKRKHYRRAKQYDMFEEKP